MHRTGLTRRDVLLLGLATAAAPLLSGCNLIGAVAYKTVGPNEVEAEHKFPPLQPTLILVENYHRGNLQPLADELARLIGGDLEAHKAAKLVDQGRLIELRSDKPQEFNQMKIQDVGKAVGATEILYVHLTELELEGVTGAEVLNGKVSATVRVVDVVTGQTKWPTIGADREFHATTNYVPQANVDSLGLMRTQILEDLSLQIAQLFYKYRPEDESKGRT